MTLETRRRLLRRLFAVLCALPTLVLASTAVVRHSSWNQQRLARRWEQQLTHWLGVSVQVQAWRETWDGEQYLLGVGLTDPESGESLAAIKSVSLSRRNGRALVRLDGAELQAPGARQLWNAVHERMLRGPDAPDWKGLLIAKDAVIWLNEEPLTLRDLRCSYVGGEASRSAIVEFGMAWYDRDQAVRWEVLRQRDGADPTTHWKVDCRNSPLPCRLLAAWGMNRWLGDSAEFAGVAGGAHSRKAGNVCQASGLLHRVDLSALTSGKDQSSGVRGTAQVRLDRAVWNQGVLVQLAGRCDALQGDADAAWLQAFARGIQTRRVYLTDEAKEVAWTDLHGVFRLDRGGLVIRGDCQRFGAAADALLARSDQPVLTPEGFAAPLASLIHHLAPLSSQPHSFAAAMPAPGPFIAADPTVRVAEK